MAPHTRSDIARTPSTMSVSRKTSSNFGPNFRSKTKLNFQKQAFRVDRLQILGQNFVSKRRLNFEKQTFRVDPLQIVANISVQKPSLRKASTFKNKRFALTLCKSWPKSLFKTQAFENLGHLGSSFRKLGASWAHVGPCWAHVGPCWGHLASILQPLKATKHCNI